MHVFLTSSDTVDGCEIPTAAVCSLNLETYINTEQPCSRKFLTVRVAVVRAADNASCVEAKYAVSRPWSFIHSFIFTEHKQYDMNRERALKVFCRTERP